MSIIKIGKGANGSKPCQICGAFHIPQNNCKFDDLAKRISLLIESNKMIPSILQANKEAVDTAKMFQSILNDSIKAFDLLQEICNRPEFAEMGPKIWSTFMFESAPKKDEAQCPDKEPISQDISQENLSTGQSTLLETEDKPSIRPASGRILLTDS